MTVTFTGSWQAITPQKGVRSALVQNPTGNDAAFVTQRLTATGVDETDPDDDPGASVVAEGSLSLEASSTFWVKGTAAQTLSITFFR